MRNALFSVAGLLAIAFALVVVPSGASMRTLADDNAGVQDAAAQQESAPDEAGVKRTRDKVKLLDNVFKQTIVLITDKYVHDEDDFAAGSAAVLLFRNISESGDNKVRLIDATGEPFEPANVARDEFEKEGIRRLKAGAATYDRVVKRDGKPYLRAVTAVPVVMDRCIMCHPHYADYSDGQPIGAITYTVPIE